MLIKIYQSDKGDCLLINSGKKNILVDGGMAGSFTKFVTPDIARMRKTGQPLDLVCVSHIDADHISGILQMVEDEVDWRVYDYHKSNGNKNIKKPVNARPPVIKKIWHNAFHETVKDNTGEIEDMLAAQANIFSASNHPLVREVGEVAFSQRQAILLSRRLRAEQLNIPLNTDHDGKLVMYRNNTAPVKIGNLSIHIIAPFEADLRKLRTDWNAWLKKNKEAIAGIKATVDKDSEALGNSLSPHINFYTSMARQFTPLVLAELTNKKLGDRNKVTPPNLASIMFLATENNKTLLMTGDGHWKDIIKGLKAINKFDKDHGAHLNVLKVQHHGSEHNLNEEFCKQVTADHYIFCGNGEHSNPDVDVVEVLINSRTSNPGITPQAKNTFTLWFNSSAKATEKDKNKTHMAKIEKLVKAKAKKYKNVKYKFIPANRKYLSLTV